jgi:hypothetical protein
MGFKSLHQFTPDCYLACGHPLSAQSGARRIWNDRELAEWATPIAAPNLRPGIPKRSSIRTGGGG